MRHLPLYSVVGADVGGKILVNEDPGLADLCSRYVPELGLGAQPFGVTTKKGSGFWQTERFHAAASFPRQPRGSVFKENVPQRLEQALASGCGSFPDPE